MYYEELRINAVRDGEIRLNISMLWLTDSVDSLEDRQKIFFSNCRKMKPAERDEEYDKIKKEYSKVNIVI